MTPEQRDGILDAVRGFLEFVDRVDIAHLTEPAEHSRAATELSQISSELRSNLIMVSEMATARLVVARSHIEAAIAVLDQRDAIPPTSVLSRSALEAAGRAWWLLDPDISTGQRLARFEAEYIYGLQEMRALVEDEPRLSDKARAELERHRARMAKYDLPNEGRPGSTDLIEHLLRPPRTGVVPRPGRVMYRLLSSWPHASAHAIFMDVDFFSTTWWPMYVALVGCFNGLDRLLDHAQIALEEWRIWSRDTWERLARLAPDESEQAGRTAFR